MLFLLSLFVSSNRRVINKGQHSFHISHTSSVNQITSRAVCTAKAIHHPASLNRRKKTEGKVRKIAVTHFASASPLRNRTGKSSLLGTQGGWRKKADVEMVKNSSKVSFVSGQK